MYYFIWQRFLVFKDELCQVMRGRGLYKFKTPNEVVKEIVKGGNDGKIYC